MADYFDVMADVVEQQQCVTEHEHGLGHAHRVGRHLRHLRLEVADSVVGQVADRPAVESRQAFNWDQLVLVHLFLDWSQWVDLA